MSSPLTRSWPRRFSSTLRRRAIVLVAVTATVVALGATVTPEAVAAPRPTPHTSAAQKSTVAVKQVCAAPTKPMQARCLSLKRTDILSHLGLRPHITPDGYGPGDLQDAYKLPGASAGGGQVVAIVDAFDNPNAESDLAVYRQQYGLAPCTTANGCFRKVNQRGEQSGYPPADPGWAGEIALDVDMVSAACPKCQILLVEGDSNSLDDLGAAVDMAVQLGAKYVSNSYGVGAEDPSTLPLNAHYDHPGVAITVSTGDNGTGPSWPATTATVTAVGGTSLSTATSARGWSESAWAGAGSGCSTQEPKPDWQDDPDCPMRAEADVSAVADPATGVAVYNSFSDGGWTVYGGTSASAPIIAGTYALGGQPAPGTYPGSYPYAARNQLFDVTSGDNGSCAIAYICHAVPGYDGPTGLGTPNGVAAFQTGPHGAVTGTVTSGGAAVVGATVTAGDYSATTDTTGTYSLTVPTGTYQMTATAYGFSTATKKGVTVTDGGSVTAAFTLATVPSRAVTGTVTDGSGHGWPLYAKITVDGVPGGPVYTDPFTGRYSLSLARGKTYPAHVESVIPGYLTTDVSLTIGTKDVVKDAAMLVDPNTCLAPGYTTNYSGLRETFDTTTKPAGWTIVDG
ncbi:MAG: carboxypeptidase regulatory-like domain-containing protein, partial [Lapillicoccus sp.]